MSHIWIVTLDNLVQSASHLSKVLLLVAVCFIYMNQYVHSYRLLLYICMCTHLHVHMLSVI